LRSSRSNTRNVSTLPGSTSRNARSSGRGSESFRSSRSSSGNTISERSTLTSLNSHGRGNSSTSFRNTSSAIPNQRLSQTRTLSTRSSYYPSHSSGFGVSIRLGYTSHYGHNNGGYYGWSSNVYYGSHAMAWRVGNAYTIVPYYSGYSYSHRGFGLSVPYSSSYRSYSYRGTHCRVRRPYWSGLSWYSSAYPYGYGYSSRNYENIYADPFYDDYWGVSYSERSNSSNSSYNDSYDDGYNRGFEDGADETSAYGDERRRDNVYAKSGEYKKKRSIDKRNTNASREYELEFKSANSSFRKADYRAASKAYKEAVITAPNNADARYGLAISAFAEGKYAYSSFNLRKGLSLNAEKGDLDLTAAFGGAVVLKDFTDNLNAEMADYPDDEDLLLLHGYVAMQNGDAKAAAYSLDKLVSANPNDDVAKALYSKALTALENK
ncbi:MAG: hypothetical protein V3V10_04845, partial [Planctomycetota bacterium]